MINYEKELKKEVSKILISCRRNISDKDDTYFDNGFDKIIKSIKS